MSSILVENDYFHQFLLIFCTAFLFLVYPFNNLLCSFICMFSSLFQYWRFSCYLFGLFGFGVGSTLCQYLTDNQQFYTKLSHNTSPLTHTNQYNHNIYPSFDFKPCYSLVQLKLLEKRHCILDSLLPILLHTFT